METKFGRWLKSRSFQYVFFLILIASVFYVGLRIGNALEWGFGLRLYPAVFFLFLVLFFSLFSLLARNGSIFICIIKRVAAYFLCFVIYDTLAMLVIDLISLFFHIRQEVRAWLIAAAAIIAILLLLYGSVHARRLKTVSYSFQWDAQNEKTRIVLLSDLHIGIFVGISYLQRVVEAVNRQEPDLIVIAGDLFDGYLPPDEALYPLAETFLKLRVKCGVYAVNGNHDPAGTDERFRKFMKDAGIHFLYNDSAILPRWNIVGRTGIVDMAEHRIPLTDLLQNTDPRKPTIVLDHDPQGIREAVSCGVDLVLCGHTHKGQFFPMTILTRAANGKRYFYGQDSFGKTHSVISAGTGFFGLPIRIGTDSEIVVLDSR